MKVGKYLQTELWSKKTSWKLLVGSGLVTGFCVAGFVGWNEYEVHWLTSGEREASRAALAEIDSMRGAESLSDEAWEDRSNQEGSQNLSRHSDGNGAELLSPQSAFGSS